MKKYFCIILSICMMISLPGCGNTSESIDKANYEVSVEASNEVTIEENDEISEEADAEISDGASIEASEEISEEDQGTKDMKIQIRAGDNVITATLYDNAAGRALWDMLPVTLPMMNLYGREMCYRFGNGGLPEDDATDTGYDIGDISYWPPAGSLVILYEQNGEVFEQQPIGHTDDDVSFFAGMPDTDIVFSKIEE